MDRGELRVNRRIIYTESPLPIDIVLVALIKCALSKLSASPNRIYLHRKQDQGNLLEAGNRRK